VVVLGAALRIMTAPYIKLNDAVIARKVQLYSESGSIACGLITRGVAVVS
jgi:hypothetical protein